ncbi:hypothetical protein K8F61_17180 [Microbacterium resistens]|uniref:Uncharacterized protein n=1 Tax=Microbacterium resistens TaxID=156977 RepID=A0ABY3RQF7_9MICO|nr:hypothetical protein [Microbacterium resistens]UGS26338.1 hypothetical protein K8F61_17180 [Microbacterium resistens]
MSRTVTAKGGPLHGKSYTIPDGTDSFPAFMGGVPGTYRVTAKQAHWQPDDRSADAELGDALEQLANSAPAVKR